MTLNGQCRLSRMAVAGGLCAAAWWVAVAAAPIEREAGSLLAGTEILSRPTDRSVVVRAIASRPVDAWVEFGASPAQLTRRTPLVSAAAGDPFDVTLTGLEPDAQYYYRLRLQPADGLPEGQRRPVRSAHTARRAGSAFTFVVQADPHLDENSSAEVYATTLGNMLADAPDFLMDLGDTAMVDRCLMGDDTTCVRQRAVEYAQVAARNALMRSYFARVAHSMPLLMTLGNHEGESGWNQTESDLTLLRWFRQARLYFFANPVPDGFFTGSRDSDPGLGLRQNYFAFEWGDALFVVLDPFSYTLRKPTRMVDDEMWAWSLGETQYRWLEQTLEGSRARFKFVFSHHMTGGSGPEGRGGVAFAHTFEWGGRNLDGSWGFAARRPGWSRPIHQLMVDTGVNIWFHGHDHVYVRETLDGVTYLEVPQPSTQRPTGPDLAAQYGYVGTMGVNAFSSSGHLRVRVAPTATTVDYVRGLPPSQETPSLRNRSVATSFSVR